MSGYISLEEAKHTLELTGLTYKDDDLSEAIDAASRGIDNYCGRRFTSGGTADVRYYTAYNTMYVDIDDTSTVTAFDTDYDGNGTYETSWTVTTDYVLEPANNPAIGLPYNKVAVAYPRTSKRLPYYTNAVRVTGTFGWTEAPPEIKRATRIMAVRLMKRTDAPFGVTGIGFDNVAVRIPTIDPDLKFLLDPYAKGGGVMVA